ncbi:hypothetical protein IFM58399_05056 [Aspergillus lentulus]|uniref:BTB domain-containing protein n=1 Tax=Aspergillus lentulus TaxID=293939 RepID=A0ABQ1ADV6_ASPLE|nr:uncharacterized protein IFM58399_05056 [Aspergillus lentulus]KAF4172304.1 hypothetical protein CNMCM8060_001715 [Aspergillus lentulus]KAF4187909.1 hypothetical protein CNMCM7927_003116 [Aspergillus lentulus]KAF4197947.1 hypothetical protein CNMCM8694_001613 [Aspergillus lentulus]GFF37903.1 hypothetical protein IFM58399_05056 [Aspergillus lentulus]GFF57769.1 hypothetical protein IFM62136_03556 [Aspergillus lentulus]
MDNDPYTLDPHGDVMLLFPNVNRTSPPSQSVETGNQSFPLASLTTSIMMDASALEQNTSDVHTTSDPEAVSHLPSTSEVSDAREEGHFESSLIGMRVSSRHLALASPVFSRMFNGNWHEAREIRSEGIAVIIMDIWDVDITLIIMNIMHGYAPKVPRKVDLDTLAKIAVMVDYYQCRGVVEVFADIWIDELKADMPKTFGKAVFQWICIAWVFRKQTEFFAATRVALVESPGVVHAYGLPIPNRVIETINESRQQGIREALAAVDRVIDDLSSSTNRCSFECSSILLGALMKFLRLSNLIFPDPRPPYDNLSIGSLTRSVVLFARSPLWEARLSTKGRPEWHSCRLGTLLDPVRRDLEAKMNGLKLEDFE